MSDVQSIRFFADLEIAAEIGVEATPRLAGLSRCVFSAPAASACFVHAFGSLATGRERATNGDTVMRVWTNDHDGYETTYPTAHLHPKYLAASTAEARYAVVFEYTVFLVGSFLRRVDGAFLASSATCQRRPSASCERARDSRIHEVRPAGTNLNPPLWSLCDKTRTGSAATAM